MRVVLDTNVLVSGILFGGVPGEILQAWRNGKIQLILSPEIMEEYHRVGEELGSRYPGVDLTAVLELLAVHAETVAASPLPDAVCEDPDDDKFLACATAGKATCIVSGDKHLLRASGYRTIEVLRPRTFVDRYLTE